MRMIVVESRPHGGQPSVNAIPADSVYRVQSDGYEGSARTIIHYQHGTMRDTIEIRGDNGPPGDMTPQQVARALALNLAGWMATDGTRGMFVIGHDGDVSLVP